MPRSKKRKPGLFGDADTKAFLFRERYKLVMQKTARHPCFSMSSASVATSCASAHADDEDGMFRLLPVEHLLGASGSDKVVVLGMLTQLKEVRFVWLISRFCLFPDMKDPVSKWHYHFEHFDWK